MTYLNKILNDVREDLLERVSKTSISELKTQINNTLPPQDTLAHLRGSGLKIIAEIKRKSPSKGNLAIIKDPVQLAQLYVNGGASLISVLTETRNFSGSINDFRQIRQAVTVPLLRKDFIISEYQIWESRAIGADLILLIAAGLSKTELKDFYALTNQLGMQALIEVHNVAEVELALELGAKIIGINNRDLKTLKVNIDNFSNLVNLIPSPIIKIAESGILNLETAEKLYSQGADAVLIGEFLVKSSDPVTTIQQLTGLERKLRLEKYEKC